MKKLTILVLSMMLIFAMSAMVMGDNVLDSGSVEVNVNVKPHAIVHDTSGMNVELSGKKGYYLFNGPAFGNRLFGNNGYAPAKSWPNDYDEIASQGSQYGEFSISSNADVNVEVTFTPNSWIDSYDNSAEYVFEVVNFWPENSAGNLQEYFHADLTAAWTHKQAPGNGDPNADNPNHYTFALAVLIPEISAVEARDDYSGTVVITISK